jgi:RNA polymerase sigma-70 factor, ECF subfamily
MSEYASPAIAQPANHSVASDQDLEISWIAASQCGDARAFNRLVLKWEKRVYNVAFRMLRDREEAEEATQDAFFLAFRNIRRFRLDSKFSTWMYRIVLNHCITRLRQRPPGVHFSLEHGSNDLIPAPQLKVGENQLGDLMQREQRHRVLTALSHLPPEQQAVIELKFFQELKFEEIAEILDVPLSTVKSRLYAGLEMLKARLGNEPRARQ